MNGQQFKVEFNGCYFEKETRDCPALYTPANVIKLEWIKDSLLNLIDVTKLLESNFIDAKDLDELICEELERLNNDY